MGRFRWWSERAPAILNSPFPSQANKLIGFQFFLGKGNHQAIVAKGNYSPNEGDVEVEVDLTLGDLERILRHRQKKLKKRQTSSGRFDSKPSSTSLEEVQRYQTFLNSVKALGGEYITESELKILKDNKN